MSTDLVITLEETIKFAEYYKIQFCILYLMYYIFYKIAMFYFRKCMQKKYGRARNL